MLTASRHSTGRRILVECRLSGVLPQLPASRHRWPSTKSPPTVRLHPSRDDSCAGPALPTVAQPTKAQPMPTATQTLLTVQDVAAELNASPIMVQRLIAFGVLKATQLRDGSILSFRVTRPSLEAYISAGSPRFTLNPGAEHFVGARPYGWFDDKDIRFLSRLFEKAVDDRLASLLPDPQERLPAGLKADPKGGTFRKVEIAVPASDIDELLTMAVPYGSRVLPNKSFPGRTNFDARWADAWLQERFWSFLQSTVMEASDASTPLGVAALYQLPETFNRLIDDAWSRLQNGRISQTKRYHFTFTEERYRDPKANLVSAAEAVQTIEVELSLKVDRIAAGAKARVVQRAL